MRCHALYGGGALPAQACRDIRQHDVHQYRDATRAARGGAYSNCTKLSLIYRLVFMSDQTLSGTQLRCYLPFIANLPFYATLCFFWNVPTRVAPGGLQRLPATVGMDFGPFGLWVVVVGTFCAPAPACASGLGSPVGTYHAYRQPRYYRAYLYGAARVPAHMAYRGATFSRMPRKLRPLPVAAAFTAPLPRRLPACARAAPLRRATRAWHLAHLPALPFHTFFTLCCHHRLPFACPGSVRPNL